MPILPAIATAASIMGDFFGLKSDQKAAKRAAAERAADRQAQLDLNQNQIQWRVADAQKAGIHPLFALNPTGMSYSPVGYGGDSGSPHISEMGQNISRAAMALMSDRERRKELARAAATAQIQGQREDVLYKQQVQRNDLENQLLASRIAQLNAPGTPPGVPDVGPGVVAVRPARTTSPSPDNPGREAGAIRDYGFADTDIGGLTVVPSYDVHERIEDNFLQQFGWAVRNQLAPVFRGLTPPSSAEHPVPPGYQWRWSPLHQQFLPARRTARGGWVYLTRRNRRR